jgi:KDO2-lipid IV(A) lauroyltransferase
MKAIRTFINILEYLALRLADGLFALVPAQRAYAIGAGVTAFFYPLFRARRRVAVDNILRAGITADPAEADRIARQSFGHLAGHLFEALKVGQVVTPENWREHVVFDGPEETFRILLEDLDTPIMILTGHHGVWEAAVSIVSFVRPMIAVARKMNNPLAERFLKKRHFRGEITIVSKKMGFAPSILRQWKETSAAMTLVMDQHAGRKQGVPVDFMGRPASTHTSPARLHLKTGAPILVGSFIRERAFHYRMVTGDPIRFTPTGDREKDTVELLTEINRRLEAAIRRYPEQYLWAHKRWR